MFDMVSVVGDGAADMASDKKLFEKTSPGSNSALSLAEAEPIHTSVNKPI